MTYVECNLETVEKKPHLFDNLCIIRIQAVVNLTTNVFDQFFWSELVKLFARIIGLSSWWLQVCHLLSSLSFSYPGAAKKPFFELEYSFHAFWKSSIAKHQPFPPRVHLTFTYDILSLITIDFSERTCRTFISCSYDLKKKNICNQFFV